MRKFLLTMLLLSCGAPQTVEVPVEPDRCVVKDPGPRPRLDCGDDRSILDLFVWARDVDRMLEALHTCPSVIMEPYR